METEKSLTVNESHERIANSRRLSIANHVIQLATALNQEISQERMALYCRGLADIGEKQLAYAFECALRQLGEFMPSIERIREYAEQWRAIDPAMETRKILNWAKETGAKAGFSKAEIAEMLEADKESQREYIAKLEADPEWRRMAARFGGKVSTSDDLAGLRNGKSDIPEDPEERKSWAKQKGEKWL